MPTFFSSDHKQFRLLPAFLAKISAAIAFYCVYTFYYSDYSTSDVYKYFFDARDIYENIDGSKQFLRILLGLQNEKDYSVLQKANFWFTAEDTTIINDNRSMIRFNLLLMPLSGARIFWHFIAMLLLSFSGMSAAFRAIVRRGTSPIPAYWAAFLLPSVLFWSSGVIKEGLLIFALGWLLFFLFVELKRFQLLRWGGILCCLGLILFVKFYVFPAICLFMCVFIPAELWQSNLLKKSTFVWTSSLAVFVLTALSAFFLPDLPQKVFEKQKAFIHLGRGGHYLKNLSTGDTLYIPIEYDLISVNNHVRIPPQSRVYEWKNLTQGKQLNAAEQNADSLQLLLSLKKSGSYFRINPVEPTWPGLVIAAPGALINALSRPFPKDLHGIPEWLAFVELMTLGILIIWRISRRKAYGKTDYPMLMGSLVFACFILVITGLTTPVAGALVRYRMPGLWFVSLALFAEKKGRPVSLPFR